MISISWNEVVAEKYPNLMIACRVIRGVSVGPRTDEMDLFLKKKEEELASKYTLEGLKDVPLIRLYRNFFWRMGVDPTKKRPASEALLRRILQGKGLPHISNVVDAYNLASAETLITLSAYDLAIIQPPLEVRFSRKGEVVELIGRRKRTLSGRELVLADVNGILCVYVHGDVERSKVNEGTKDVLLVAYGAPGITRESLIKALKKATDYIEAFAGGREEEIMLSSPTER